jgi:hypothetical protein
VQTLDEAGTAGSSSAGMDLTAAVAVRWGSFGRHVTMLFFNAYNMQYFLAGCCPTRV